MIIVENNSGRVYPFNEDCERFIDKYSWEKSLRSEYDPTVIPDGFVLDVSLVVFDDASEACITYMSIGGSQESPELSITFKAGDRLYRYGPDRIYVSDKDDTLILRNTLKSPDGGEMDVSIVIGLRPVLDVVNSPSGEWSYDFTGDGVYSGKPLKIVSSCVKNGTRHPLRFVCSNLTLPPGIVGISNGYNMSVSKSLTFSSGSGIGLGKAPNDHCSDEVDNCPPGLTPVNGNIIIKGDDCKPVQALPNQGVLLVQGACEACCSCEDYQNVINAMGKLNDKWSSLWDDYDEYADDLNDLLDDYNNKLDDRSGLQARMLNAKSMVTKYRDKTLFKSVFSASVYDPTYPSTGLKSIKPINIKVRPVSGVYLESGYKVLVTVHRPKYEYNDMNIPYTHRYTINSKADSEVNVAIDLNYMSVKPGLVIAVEVYGVSRGSYSDEDDVLVYHEISWNKPICSGASCNHSALEGYPVKVSKETLLQYSEMDLKDDEGGGGEQGATAEVIFGRVTTRNKKVQISTVVAINDIGYFAGGSIPKTLVLRLFKAELSALALESVSSSSMTIYTPDGGSSTYPINASPRPGGGVTALLGGVTVSISPGASISVNVSGTLKSAMTPNTYYVNHYMEWSTTYQGVPPSASKVIPASL